MNNTPTQRPTSSQRRSLMLAAAPQVRHLQLITFNVGNGPTALRGWPS